ncbi:MAG: hypothetical protein JO121_26790 [Deltaproteobacteria bacterium]|nr:hypothetical protein [Deltaproteobacteria bacterium]
MTTDRLPHQSANTHACPPANEYPSEMVTTDAARQVWEHLYATPWPEGWTVRWQARWPRKDGKARVCHWERKLIELNWCQTGTPGSYDPILCILLHEFTHLRFPRLCHGKRFTRLVQFTYERLTGERLFAQREERREPQAHRRWARLWLTRPMSAKRTLKNPCDRKAQAGGRT